MSDRARSWIFRAVSRVSQIALVTLATLGSGCTVSFWHPGGGDAQVDAGPLPDGAPPPDGAGSDAALDAAVDAAVFHDAAPVPDGGCPAGSKECAATCVTLDNPAYGCADPGCDPCLYDHAAAQCVAGACAMGPCTGSWEDCDGNAGNGCEIDLATNANNCGQCGHVCSAINANMGCAASDCVFLSCMGDWRDCDGNIPSNGCETLVTADDQNCGACGYVCPAGFNCNTLNCRCTTDADCDTGGGGVCSPSFNMCSCPTVLCSGPCNATGNGCL